MGVRTRLLSLKRRLRALMRSQDGRLAPSRQDIEAFGLERYSPPQQREIAKLIARQPVVSRGDIADVLDRAERRTRRTGPLTGAAAGLGFVAIFALGAMGARHEQPPSTGADPTAGSSALLDAGGTEGRYSPGGLDEADKAFFADLQAGRISTAIALPRPREAAASIAEPVVVRAIPPASPPPAPAASRRATVIQLGAFADPADAKARWHALSSRYPSLRPLTQTVSAVALGGRTLYRLRASGIDAANTCSALASAGATCFVATDEG